MSSVISTFSELAASPSRTFLDAFSGGGEYIMVWSAPNSNELRFGGAIKAAPQKPLTKSSPLDLTHPFEVLLPAFFGAFDPYNQRILAWTKEPEHPSIGYLGLVELPTAQLMTVCIPFQDLRYVHVPLP